MFDIRLLEEENVDLEGCYRLGSIRIGSFKERFACYPIANASIDQLPKLWLEALTSLSEGEPAITLLHDPKMAWVIYREGQDCYVQQKLVLNQDFSRIEPRTTVDEDGDRVSEWHVELSAIKRWVMMQA